jgi:xanthine dehydrogenase YagS FAD-binding subunit
VRHSFAYYHATAKEEAASRLREDSASVPLGGGTDLLVFIDEGLARPTALVDLRDVAGLRDIVSVADGGLRIGAAARIDDVAREPRVRSRYPALAQACAAVGTPALRQMGTVGGNLCQRPRCWYFRRAIPCLKNGGNDCPAVEGENQYHAILEGGPCHAVHPSDPAVALVALGAVIEITGAQARASAPVTRTCASEEFFALPTERLDRETNLATGEFVSAVILPDASAAGEPNMQRYYKEMQRGTWDFALVSLAAIRRRDGAVRLVLGGVAPRPWRVVASVEEDVASGGLDEDTVATLADRALYDARPLSKNAYKIDIAANLLRRGIRDLTA